MHSADGHPKNQLREHEAGGCLNVLIAYENSAALMRARTVYQRLVKELGCGFHFVSNSWKFSVLSEPSVGQIAAQDARQADIVIVALADQQQLADSFKKWLELWVRDHEAPAALVALCAARQQPPEQSPEALAYLRDMARSGRMDFFAEPDYSCGSPVQSPLSSPHCLN